MPSSSRWGRHVLDYGAVLVDDLRWMLLRASVRSWHAGLRMRLQWRAVRQLRLPGSSLQSGRLPEVVSVLQFRRRESERRQIDVARARENTSPALRTHVGR